MPDAAPMIDRWLEDYRPGQVFGSGTVHAEPARMTAFAAEFDPQPFHLREAEGAASIFGGLAASGWHTAALTMRLLVGGELRPAGGVIGLGFEELRWPKPVRPGDVLTARSEILEVRPSKSRPHEGVIKVRITTTNQDGEAVQIAVGSLLVRRRGD